MVYHYVIMPSIEHVDRVHICCQYALSCTHTHTSTCSIQRSPLQFKHYCFVSIKVALGYVNEKTNTITHRCGGTIISDLFILTAAHCTDPNQPPVVVRLGTVSKTLCKKKKKIRFTQKNHIRQPKKFTNFIMIFHTIVLVQDIVK